MAIDKDEFVKLGEIVEERLMHFEIAQGELDDAQTRLNRAHDAHRQAIFDLDDARKNLLLHIGDKS